MWKKGNFRLLVRMSICTVIMENSMVGFLKKLKMEYHLVISLLGIFPKTLKLVCEKLYSNVRCSTIKNTQEMDKVIVHQLIKKIKKMWSMYTVEYYSTTRRMKSVICSNMHATRDHYSK